MDDAGLRHPEGERETVARRLSAQLLTTPTASSPVEVVDRLLAIQAQDGRGMRLAVRPRSTGVHASDLERALTQHRSVVVSWLNRGTLHLVTSTDHWWLHALTTPQLQTANRRRLREEGVDEGQAARGAALVADAVRREGPLTRSQLRERLGDAGVPCDGQAFVHLALAATIAGDLVRGPVVGDELAFVSPAEWLGPPPSPLDRDDALGRLARRYLAGHGPATGADLAKWAGITLGDARRGLETIADEVESSAGGLVLGGSLDHRGGMPPPRLLGAFDPVLHGWVDRSALVGSHRGVVTRNGMFRPTAIVDGRVVGTWALAAGTVTLRLLEGVEPDVLAALDEDAGAVLAYLGRRPSPLRIE